MLQISICGLFAQQSAFDTARQHYRAQGDTLKLKALAFLEDNIDVHDALKCYYTDSLGRKIDFNELSYPNYNASKEALNALQLKLYTEKIEDKSVLTAENLIEIINRSFENWQREWNKNLSFDDFCDYLLPYKVQNEPIENWYHIFENKFSYLSNNLSSPSEICKNVNANLKTWFFSSWAYEKRDAPFCLSPSQLLFRQEGHCQDMCNLSVYALRSLGVACSIDFTPAWATSSFNHWWCSFIDENGKHRAFEGTTGNAENFVIFREPGKVFRLGYRKQNSALAAKISKSEIPKGHLQMENIIDVTNEYWRTTSIKCAINNKVKSDIAYLAIFNAMQWKPVDWAKISNDTATFSKLAVGVVYLPMNYENGKTSSSGFPVLINSDKTTKTLKINKQELINITVTEAAQYLFYRIGKKYTFFFWDGKWVNAGTKTATVDKILTFNNIPSNTVYLLVPEYSQRKDRIFTVNEKGEIERW
jgi:hypothetical protein